MCHLHIGKITIDLYAILFVGSAISFARFENNICKTIKLSAPSIHFDQQLA